MVKKIAEPLLGDGQGVVADYPVTAPAVVGVVETELSPSERMETYLAGVHGDDLGVSTIRSRGKGSS